MKTFNGKNITKKEIQNVLRTMNATKIFRLHKIMFGNVDRWSISDFIFNYAPTEKVSRAAWKIAYNNSNAIKRSDYEIISCRLHGRYTGKDLKQAVDAVKEYIADPCNPYAKKPMMGFTHLYFCSPAYGHQDYNKWRSIEIKGNEKFCETICKLADKYSK